MIVLILFLIVIVVFAILILSLMIHRKSLKDEKYYNMKLASIRNNTMMMERAAEEIMAVTQSYKAEKELREITCGRNPKVECTLCDKECLLRRRDLDE